MTHWDLEKRAIRWLSGTKRCDPVLSGIASCSEIPDAIGWGPRGSIVVECKCSLSDFRADMNKYVRYLDPQYKWSHHGSRLSKEEKATYEVKHLPRMGDYRYYLCEPGVIEPKHISLQHGLLYVQGRSVRVIVEAERRTENVNQAAEIRYLRFALIHIRKNLLANGFSVDMTKLTKFFGKSGLKAAEAEPEQLRMQL